MQGGAKEVLTLFSWWGEEETMKEKQWSKKRGKTGPGDEAYLLRKG